MPQPLLGRLPREEGKSAVAVIPSAGAAPTRPAEVHNIELDAADTNMYGNDVWGDCVFVMIEKDRVISAEALGVAITKLTPSQVITNYCDFTGVHTAPGPGANILDVLKWAQNHPERFGGSKLLFYGDIPINDEAMKQAVAEFASVCVGVVVYQSMEYPNKVWYNAPRGANVGGHGIAGGSYTAAANFIKTWGYMVEINSAGFTTIEPTAIKVRIAAIFTRTIPLLTSADSRTPRINRTVRTRIIRKAGKLKQAPVKCPSVHTGLDHRSEIGRPTAANWAFR